MDNSGLFIFGLLGWLWSIWNVAGLDYALRRAGSCASPQTNRKASIIMLFFCSMIPLTCTAQPAQTAFSYAIANLVNDAGAEARKQMHGLQSKRARGQPE
jgi:hypothetical protein